MVDSDRLQVKSEKSEATERGGGWKGSPWKFHSLRRICTELYVWKFTERGNSISLRRICTGMYVENRRT